MKIWQLHGGQGKAELTSVALFYSSWSVRQALGKVVPVCHPPMHSPTSGVVSQVQLPLHLKQNPKPFSELIWLLCKRWGFASSKYFGVYFWNWDWSDVPEARQELGCGERYYDLCFLAVVFKSCPLGCAAHTSGVYPVLAPVLVCILTVMNVVLLLSC